MQDSGVKSFKLANHAKFYLEKDGIWLPDGSDNTDILLWENRKNWVEASYIEEKDEEYVVVHNNFAVGLIYVGKEEKDAIKGTPFIDLSYYLITPDGFLITNDIRDIAYEDKQGNWHCKYPDVYPDKLFKDPAIVCLDAVKEVDIDKSVLDLYYPPVLKMRHTDIYE